MNLEKLHDLMNDMASVLEMNSTEENEYVWEGSREDAKEMVMYSSPDEMTSVVTELYHLIECMELELRSLQEDHEDEESEREPRQGPNDPECDDDLVYRENMAADSGDESSKAAYMEYYSRMGMEGDY